MPVSIILFIISCIVLAKSATVLVDALKKIAGCFGFSQFVLSFFLMAITTSLPELFVGVTSAIEKRPNLSLGNVIGANISNVTLTAGLATIMARGILVEPRINKKDAFYMNLAGIAPLVFLWDLTLSRTDGVILLLIYVLYLYTLIAETKRYSKKEKTTDHLFKNIAKFALGVIILVTSADMIVKTSGAIALELGVPLILIGIVIVSIGTTLPELSFEIQSMMKRQSGLAFGNILGSVVTNSTLILGVVSIITPIQVESISLFTFSALFMVLITLLFTAFLRSGYRLSWKEGYGLVFLYIIFVIIEFLVAAQV